MSRGGNGFAAAVLTAALVGVLIASVAVILKIFGAL